jgi:hypothetical protein
MNRPPRGTWRICRHGARSAPDSRRGPKFPPVGADNLAGGAPTTVRDVVRCSPDGRVGLAVRLAALLDGTVQPNEALSERPFLEAEVRVS